MVDLEAGEVKRRRSEGLVKRIERHRKQLEAWEAFCLELGEPPAVVALSWLLGNSAVTAPIVGPRTMDQLESALHSLEVSLDEGARGRLDEIFPGPGGPAPEAYAW